MKSFSITLETDPGCHCVGDRVLVQLKTAYLATAVCESGLIEGTIKSYAKYPNGCYNKYSTVWDTCKKIFIPVQQQVNRYTHTYEIEYDDETQVVPEETLILSDWVESLCCMSCADSIILDAVGGLCGATGGGGGLTDLTVEQEVTECGRDVNFISGGTEIASVTFPDRRRVTHVAHGYGVPGKIIALKPDISIGTYTLAQANDNLNVASHLAGIVDADSYDLLAPGFYSFPNHGYVVGVHYALSHTTLGEFLPVSNIPRAGFLQQCFKVETANCLYLGLEEAQPPEGCCNIINKVGHGFDVGTIVAQISGMWVMAIANTPGAMIVLEVLDANNFVVGLGGCLQGLSGIVASESYVVSPTTPGAITPVKYLSHNSHQAHRPVGVGVAEGCIIVNMSAAHTYLCNCGLGDYPDDPDALTALIFRTSFSELDVDNNETCGYNSQGLAVTTTETAGRDPYWSSVVVGTDTGNCSFQSTIPVGVTDGLGHQALYYNNMDKDCVKFSVDVATNNLGDVAVTNFFGLRGSDVGGTFSQDGIDIQFYMTETQLQVQSNNTSGGPILTVDGVFPISLLPNTWYRVSGEIQLNTVGNPDGYMTIVLQLLDGDMTSGSNGLVLGNIVNETVDNQEFRDTTRGINTYIVKGFVATNVSPTPIVILVDNVELREC